MRRDDDVKMRISQFAQIIGRSIDTVRGWDIDGKLKADREFGQRVYRSYHIAQAQALTERWKRRKPFSR